MEGTLIRTTSFAAVKDGCWASRVYQLFASKLERKTPNRQEILDCARRYLFDNERLSLKTPFTELLVQCEREFSCGMDGY